MVIQMRTFVTASWLNADENDYSGRQQSHMVGNMANLAAYADPEPVKKAKKVKAPDFRLTSEKTIDRLEKHRADLEAAFESGQLSFERYDVLLREWEAKMDRAWKRHEKATGESFEEVANEPNIITKPSIINHIEDSAKGFAAKHSFAFLVGSIMVGASILNVFGFGA